MLKKIRWILICILVLALIPGCGKKEEKHEKSNEQKELLPIAKDNFCYEVSEQVQAITVDEMGLLYTVRSRKPELQEVSEDGEGLKNLAVQTFEVYDLNGDCIVQKELEFGTGGVVQMLVDGKRLYCVVIDQMNRYVYCIDTVTWEAVQIGKLLDYQTIETMVLIGDYLYVLGCSEKAEAKSYTIHPEVLLYNYAGEQICRINVTEENAKTEKMKVDFPIYIYGTDKDTLMIYQYTEEKAFSFLEFDPVAATLTEKEWSHTDVQRDYLSQCGEGFTYINQRCLYYGTVDGVEVQLLPDKITMMKPAVYQKGFVFYVDNDCREKVNRICVEDIIQENKEIRVLSNQYPMDVPFGCGYQMRTKQVNADEFALKVLAQDNDFDLYQLSSREDCAYNLKKNGAFYSLNDVEGVKEYLDACFPYVKEMAYDEEGKIWMVPVGLAIPGIIYNKEYCANADVDYAQMNYLELLSFLDQVETETPELASMSIFVLYEELFMQYLSNYDSFDTEVFRTHLSKFKEIYTKHGEWGISDVYGRSLINREAAEFYLEYNVYSKAFLTVADRMGDSDAYGIIGTPKVAEGIGNMGTITFLAVNPQSENLEDTLKYISDFAKYMLTKRDSFLLADAATYSKTPLIQELYQLYAKGSIDFRMDSEVYWEVFESYLLDEISLEEAIAEAERKRKIYVGE